MNCQEETLKTAIFSMETTKTYRLDIDKIKTLDDVKKVLDGLCIEIRLQEGLTSKTYEKLKDYLKQKELY